MILVHKIRLYPNNEQATLFAKSFGVARFACNWALAQWKRQYEEGEKPNEGKLRKQLDEIKEDQFPWRGEVGKTALQQAIKNLGAAFKHTFARLKKGGEPGFPKFKRKGVHDSFRANNGTNKNIPNAVKVEGEKYVCRSLVGPIWQRNSVLIHKLTNKLSRAFEVLAVENLNVNGMVKNHCLARAVCDAGFFDFRRQLEYKSAMNGAKVAVMDRWFPNNKTCSPCGTIHDMPLSKRTVSWVVETRWTGT